MSRALGHEKEAISAQRQENSDLRSSRQRPDKPGFQRQLGSRGRPEDGLFTVWRHVRAAGVQPACVEVRARPQADVGGGTEPQRAELHARRQPLEFGRGVRTVGQLGLEPPMTREDGADAQ
jgi:hypothetical protein